MQTKHHANVLGARNLNLSSVMKSFTLKGRRSPLNFRKLFASQIFPTSHNHVKVEVFTDSSMKVIFCIATCSVDILELK